MPSFDLNKQLRAIEKLENSKNQLEFAKKSLSAGKDEINNNRNEGNKETAVNGIDNIYNELSRIQQLINEYEIYLRTKANNMYNQELEYEQEQERKKQEEANKS